MASGLFSQLTPSMRWIRLALPAPPNQDFGRALKATPTALVFCQKSPFAIAGIRVGNFF